MTGNPCPYCEFTASRLHVLFDHLERQHVLDLVGAATAPLVELPA